MYISKALPLYLCLTSSRRWQNPIMILMPSLCWTSWEKVKNPFLIRPNGQIIFLLFIIILAQAGFHWPVKTTTTPDKQDNRVIVLVIVITTVKVFFFSTGSSLTAQSMYVHEQAHVWPLEDCKIIEWLWSDLSYKNLLMPIKYI